MIPNQNHLQLNTQSRFLTFIFKSKENSQYLVLTIIVVTLQLIIFKYCYPFPNLIFMDSIDYISAAFNNDQISSHPIGYSILLRIFSAITISDTILITFQYIFLQSAALALNFTLFYFYSPSRLIKSILLLVMLFNPLFFPISNTISSDNYYLSLCIIWFTLLLWIIYQPDSKLYIWHAIVMYLAFTTRFNAIFLPIVSIYAFYHSKSKIKTKIVGVLLCCILLGSFIIYNRQKYYELYGTRQFSAFSGWQMANNGLYTYRYVPDSLILKVPKKFEVLDNVVRDYFRNARKDPNNTIEQTEAFDNYIWHPKSPLWIYINKYFKPQNESLEDKKWAIIAPLYKDYGIWLITHYPIPFFQHIIIPHIKTWFFPPMYSLVIIIGDSIIFLKL